MAIITVANTKGGVGKSTLAANLAAAFEQAGRSVSVFDLDLQQRSLSHFITARRNTHDPGAGTITLADLDFDPALPAAQRGAAFRDRFEALARELSAQGAVVIIDLPAGGGAFGGAALELTDVVITPMNDSLVDLSAIETAGGEVGELGWLVSSARRRRKDAGRPPFCWAVVLNRVSPLDSHHSKRVKRRLEEMSQHWSFALAGALTERIAHRTLFDEGRTLVDQAAAQSALAPSLEHGHREISSLMGALGLNTCRGRAAAAQA